MLTLQETVLTYVLCGLLVACFFDWFVWKFTTDRLDAAAFVFMALLWPLIVTYAAVRLIVLCYQTYNRPSSGQ